MRHPTPTCLTFTDKSDYTDKQLSQYLSLMNTVCFFLQLASGIMFSWCVSILFPTNTFHKDFNIHWWSLSGLVVSQGLSKWGFSNSVIISLLAAILHQRIHPSTTTNKLQFLLKLHTGYVYPPCIWEFHPSSAWSVTRTRIPTKQRMLWTRTGTLPWKEFAISCFIGHAVFVASSQLCHCMKAAMDPEEALAPHSSTLAWKIPWTQEPGALRSMGSLRVRHDWATSLSLFTFMHCRRKWQPTPVFLPGESQGRGSLVGCRLWGRTESDTTETT